MGNPIVAIVTCGMRSHYAYNAMAVTKAYRIVVSAKPLLIHSRIFSQAHSSYMPLPAKALISMSRQALRRLSSTLS